MNRKTETMTRVDIKVQYNSSDTLAGRKQFWQGINHILISNVKNNVDKEYSLSAMSKTCLCRSRRQYLRPLNQYYHKPNRFTSTLYNHKSYLLHPASRLRNLPSLSLCPLTQPFLSFRSSAMISGNGYRELSSHVIFAINPTFCDRRNRTQSNEKTLESNFRLVEN